MRMTRENEDLSPYEARKKHIESIQRDIHEEMLNLNIDVADALKEAGLIDIGMKLMRIMELSGQDADLIHEFYYNELQDIRAKIIEGGGPDVNLT